MIHDVGKLVFLGFFPELYADILKKAGACEKPLLVLEQEVFAINHAEVGRSLCRRWQLPDELLGIVSRNHLPVTVKRPSSEIDHMIYVVRVADQLGRIAINSR